MWEKGNTRREGSILVEPGKDLVRENQDQRG
jgi:hypothetical protein